MRLVLANTRRLIISTPPRNVGMAGLKSKSDTDNDAWVAALASAGGSANATEKAAVLQWFLDEKSGGSDAPWPAITASGKGHVNFHLGDFVSCFIAQVPGDTTQPDNNTGFVDVTNYSRTTGLTANGAGTKYILEASGGLVSLQSDFHYWQYNRGASADAGSNNQSFLGFGDVYIPYIDNVMYLDVADNNTRYSAAVTPPYGLLLASYQHGVGAVLSQRGVDLSPLTTVAHTTSANTGTQIYFQSTYPSGGFGIGTHMTAAQRTIHAAAVQRLQTTLGRQV